MHFIIDLNHPADFHFFKNSIRKLEEKEHFFSLLAKDKDCLYELLQYSGFSFIPKGKRGKGVWRRFIYILKSVSAIILISKKKKASAILSLASPYAVIAGWMLKIPVLTFNDTEHILLIKWIFQWFSDSIITPYCFRGTYGKKQIRINSYKELAYLHPRYFTPDLKVPEACKFDASKKNILLRFVDHTAIHDFGVNRLNDDQKIELVERLSAFGAVYISSEIELPWRIQSFKLNIQAVHMHHFLVCIDLLIGESGTMSAEAAMLGTPAIYLDDKSTAYIKAIQQEYNLIFRFACSEKGIRQALDKAEELVMSKSVKNEAGKSARRLIEEKEDTTEIMLKTVDNLIKKEITAR
ncbi:DUF354 domain-containing protein [Bacteroidota bacterium]